jgi:hypothetical protein
MKAPKSYIKNCFIKAKETDRRKNPLFYFKDGEIYARLDGYAIIPKDEYYKLVGYDCVSDTGTKNI